MKQLEFFIKTVLIIILPIINSCKKGKGAICNDGTRSHSTGSGTCSWHGGVKHYINPNEISIPDTIGLVLLLIFSTWFIGNLINDNKKKKRLRSRRM
jgi:hypothetical protein